MASVSEVRLSREMRLRDITMIGVGAMIGAGIFVLTGIAAGVAGPGLLLAFLLNGFVTLFAAAAYAELGSCFHSAGGGYLYVKTGLKDPQGFMSGWMSWFAYVVACALYALGFGAYFHLVLNMLGIAPVSMPLMGMEKWLAVGVVVLFSYINYRGASEAGGAGNIVTMGKMAVLMVFVAFGLWATFSRPHWQDTFTNNFLPNGFGHVFIAMGLTFIAYEGYEIIAQCSEEVRAPERNVPRAIFLSLLIVVPTYLLVGFVALGAVHPAGMASWQFLGQQKETALVDVASHFFRGGGIMIVIGGLLSTMSALNATIYSSSRVSFAMGRDRNLPSWFGRVHAERKTPHWAILVSGVLAAIMASALPVEAVASAADILFLLLFIQVLAVLIALRKKRPDLPRGYKVPWVPVVPAIGIVLQLALAVYLFVYSPMAWVSAGIWIGLGLVVYYAYARKRDRAYGQLVEAREAAERREYRILACVGNPDRTRVIENVAGAIARHYDGELVLFSVVEVADGELLAHGLDRVDHVRTRLDDLQRGFGAAGLPAKAVVQVAHRVSYGITEAVLDERCNLIVMGRERHSTMMERFAATTVDRVVREAPAQVVVVTAESWPERIREILFAYEAGPHTQLAADVMQAFADAFQAQIRIVQVLPRTAGAAAVQRAQNEMVQTFGDRFVQGEKKVALAGDIVNGLLRESRTSDLIVMGGSEAGLIAQLLGYALPHELADRTNKPVITVHEMAEQPKRWIR